MTETARYDSLLDEFETLFDFFFEPIRTRNREFDESTFSKENDETKEIGQFSVSAGKM